jgi:hypothetical protein
MLPEEVLALGKRMDCRDRPSGTIVFGPQTADPSGSVWVRKHEVAHDTIKLIASGDELAESPASGTERIEFFDGQRVGAVRPPKIDELPRELLHDSWLDWFVDARMDLDVTGIVEGRASGLR